MNFTNAHMQTWAWFHKQYSSFLRTELTDISFPQFDIMVAVFKQIQISYKDTCTN